MRRCASLDCDLDEEHSLVRKAKKYHGVSFENKSRNALSNLNNISAVFTRRLRNTTATKKNSVPAMTSNYSNRSFQLILQADVMVANLTTTKGKKKFKSRHLMLYSDRIYLNKITNDQVEDQSFITYVWLTLPCMTEFVDESMTLDETLWIGWPLINYVIRFPTSEMCTLWYNAITNTIKNARKNFKDAPEAMKVHVILDTSSKEELSINCKNLFVESYENTNTLLHQALISFKLQNFVGVSDVDLWFIYNDCVIKLVGYELPYWIAMWSVQRAHSTGCSGQLLNHENLTDAHAYNVSPMETKLDEQSMHVKFLLRPKKDAIQGGSNAKLEDLLDSNAQNANKTRLKSLKGLSQLLNRGGKSKSDDSDGQNIIATPAVGNGQLFGRSLQEIYPDGEIGPSVMALLGYAYALIPNLEGPFRVSGNIIQIKRLQLALDEISPKANIDMKVLFEVDSSRWPSPATILGLLKKFLSNIPDQLLQQSQLARWLEAWRQPNTEERLRSFRDRLKHLPSANFRLSELVFCLCDWVLKHLPITKLNVQGLSTSLGPSLLAPLDSFDVDAQCQINEMVAFLIENFDNLWQGSNASDVLDATKSAIYADDLFVDSSDHLDNLDTDCNLTLETISLDNMVSLSDSSLLSSDMYKSDEIGDAPPPRLPPRKRAPQPPPPRIVAQTRRLRNSRRPSLQRLSSGPSEGFTASMNHSSPNFTRMSRALRPRSISVESLSHEDESLPTYDKALERQVQLRLENFNVSSSSTSEDVEEQKFEQRMLAFERRVPTRLRHHPPVHVAIGNARAARVHLQNVPTTTTVTPTATDGASIVLSAPQRPARVRQLPKEYDIFIGKESYV